MGGSDKMLMSESVDELKIVESVDETTVDAPRTVWRYTLNVIAVIGILKHGKLTLWPHIFKSL